MFSRIALVAALCAPLSWQAPAVAPKQAPDAQTLPSGRSLIDKHIAAIGGRDAILSHKSSHGRGTLSVPASGITGTIEIFNASNPNRTMTKVSISGVGDILSGYDGSHGWTDSALTGAMLNVGKELEQTKYDSDFYSELRDPKIYPNVTTLEKTTFEGRPCYKVKLSRIDGTEDIDFYDVETGLRDGGIATRETPMGKVTATNVESDYKKFGNLMQATKVTQRITGVEQVITLQSMEYDKVEDAAFEPPAEIKALIR